MPHKLIGSHPLNALVAPMRKPAAALTLLLLFAPVAHADTAHQAFNYFGGLATGVHGSENRDGSGGAGFSAFAGRQLTPQLGLELGLNAHYLDRQSNNEQNYYYRSGVDVVWNANSGPERHGVFLIGGLAAAYEDEAGFENLYPALNAGVGLLLPSPWSQLKIRSEARYWLTFGRDEIDRDHAYGDGSLGLGLQWNTRAPAVVEAAPTDADGDGVTDAADLCPNTPSGTAVDANGCPANAADADGDGVLDVLDQCPGTPTGTPVDAAGCALPAVIVDADADGVDDASDACLGTPKGFKVDARGCVVPQKLVVPGLQFESGSAVLTEAATAEVVALGKDLAQQTLLVKVTGHTDALGPQSFNLNLSQKRAAAVAKLLAEQGVNKARILSNGEGEFDPIASNDTEAGRAENRRVEVELTAQ